MKTNIHEYLLNTIIIYLHRGWEYTTARYTVMYTGFIVSVTSINIVTVKA